MRKSSKIWPILKREYLTRVSTKGFWLSTALVPLFLGATMILPSLLAYMSKQSPEPVVIVDRAGDFFPVVKQTFTGGKGSEKLPPVVLEPINGRSDDQLRQNLNDRSEKGELQGYLIVDPKLLAGDEMIYFARNPSSALSADNFTGRLRQAVTKYRLSKMGLSTQQIGSATKRVELDVQKATNDPKKRESGASAVIMAIMLVMFIYFSLLFYGIYVLKGVLEEKSNRIVEVIVSSVKPFELMMGKIFGIGAVGLTQISIWAFFLLLFTAPSIAAGLSISTDFIPKINGAVLAFFPVYFILGYFLFATIYAGIGSMFNSDEDAQQMVGLANMMLVVPIICIAAVMKNPNGTLATSLSLFPFFSPIIMYLRIAIQMPPAWQVALSIVLMIVTILFMVWIVSKIYRVGILMYGKKPTIPELVRWLRYT